MQNDDDMCIRLTPTRSMLPYTQAPCMCLVSFFFYNRSMTHCKVGNARTTDSVDPRSYITHKQGFLKQMTSGFPRLNPTHIKLMSPPNHPLLT